MKWLIAAALAVLSCPAASAAEAVEDAVLTFAPNVPPTIARKTPATVRLTLKTAEAEGVLMEGLGKPTKYEFWTFNGHVPGPFIRVRVGDTLELTLTNDAESSMPHNIDLHAVTGPGGGAPITLAKPGETKTARMKMLNPGLYVYHCAAPTVADHVANGMYGLIYVEPETPLPKVDHEFYVMQSEFYTKQDRGAEGLVNYDRQKALHEDPTYVVFNGKFGSLMDAGALKAKTGERVRFFFGNGGPNKTSAFHVIGTIFDDVYREGGVGAAPEKNIQTTSVPPGGSVIADLGLKVPGNFTIVDHAVFRFEKGAIGILHADGPDAPDIYSKVK